MSDEQDRIGLGRPTGTDFPETPHDLPYNRPRIDELLVRVRNGERIDLLSEESCSDASIGARPSPTTKAIRSPSKKFRSSMPTTGRNGAMSERSTWLNCFRANS
ncbi:MAG: hypothetical protein R2845_14785 [Thermomicrobiales bacterium]